MGSLNIDARSYIITNSRVEFTMRVQALSFIEGEPNVSFTAIAELRSGTEGGPVIRSATKNGTVGFFDKIDDFAVDWTSVPQGNYAVVCNLITRTDPPQPLDKDVDNITVGTSGPTIGSISLAADDPKITSSTDPVMFTVTVKDSTGALMPGITGTYSVDGATPDGNFAATDALGTSQFVLMFSDTQNHQIFASAGGKNSNLITITPNTTGGGIIGNLSPWVIGGGIIALALALRRR
jgi:hypothetical protein